VLPVFFFSFTAIERWCGPIQQSPEQVNAVINKLVDGHYSNFYSPLQTHQRCEYLNFIEAYVFTVVFVFSNIRCDAKSKASTSLTPRVVEIF